MSLCPEGAYRDSLSDEDFWAHVFGTDYADYTDDFVIEDDLPENTIPCPVCGSTGACSYDSNGNPMIHTIEDNE